MSAEQLVGRVFVVAGEEPVLAVVAAAAYGAGARVAVVSQTLPDVAATVRFRTDPADAGAWERIGMHVEQHLGPVDGAAADRTAAPVVTEVFGADLDRRGHGAVVAVDDDSDAAQVLRVMLDRR